MPAHATLTPPLASRPTTHPSTLGATPSILLIPLPLLAPRPPAAALAQRNDFPLLLTLTAVFVAPALIILAIAYGSGYLDNLYSSSLTLR